MGAIVFCWTNHLSYDERSNHSEFNLYELLAMRKDQVVEAAALVGVMLLALFLRVGWPGTNSFGFDEARLSLMALNMARGGQFARLGMQSSTGVPNFPAAVWIFTPSYWLSKDPLVSTLFVGLVGTLAVAGIWWLGRRAWGPWAGITTALLLAASPFAVLYSRSIWSQNLLAPLAVLWALTGVIGVSRDRSWAVAANVFLAGFALQVHIAGAVLVIGTLFLILRFSLWRRWLAILIGGALALLSVLPYIYTLWCCGAGARADLLRIWQQPAITDLTAIRQTFRVGAGINWEFLVVGKNWIWGSPLGELMDLTSLVVLLLIIAGLACLARQAWLDWRTERRDWRAVLTALVPVWAFSAAIMFLRYKTPVYPQYTMAVLPALFLAAGSVAAWKRWRFWSPAVVITVLIAILIQTIPIVQGLDIASDINTPGGMGTPLERPRYVAESLKDGNPIVVHTFGDIPEYFGDAATFDVLLWDYPHQIVDARSVLLLPDLGTSSYDSVHILSMFSDLPAWEELKDIGLEGLLQEFPRRSGDKPFVALTIDEVVLDDFQRVEPVLLANGAQLQGWKVRAVDGGLRLVTWWRIVGSTDAKHYQQFNHLRDGKQAEPVAIHDVNVSSSAWQPGDNIITWVDFDRPAESGPYFIDVGMYTWPEIERSPVLERSGDPLAPIRLGPFEIPLEEQS
jgi:hypothetical protein